ncbi:hypothetical protein H0G86_001559 [Trichoderma simmonsii]|uniref:Uncharacterized protein n=1 Tax=Trichoderma simmonsii TaxID=1491479 RepID=A0A8G0PBB5_9HYPO|nr:hypothetical protein H0G86_001559 [Trichoderma simmonsii]
MLIRKLGSNYIPSHALQPGLAKLSLLYDGYDSHMFGIERILVCPTLALARPLVVMSEAATPFDHGSAYDRRIFLTPPPLAATLSGLCPIKGIAAAVDSQRSSGRSFLVSTPVLARSLPRAGLARAGSTTRRRPHRVSSSRHGSVSLGLLAVL